MSPNADPNRETSKRVIPRPTPLQSGLIAMLMLSAVVNYIDRQATAAVSPTLMPALGIDEAEWGWVGAAFFAVYVPASYFGGMWIDRIGVRRGLIISTTFWSFAAMMHALAFDLPSLIACRMLLSLGEGAGGAALLKGVRRVVHPAHRDVGSGIVGSGSLLGALLTPLTVIPLTGMVGWRAAFLFTGIVGLLWVPVWAIVASRPPLRLEPGEDGTGSERPWFAAAWEAWRGIARDLLARRKRSAVSAGVQADPVSQPLNMASWGIWATLLTIFFTIPPTVFTLQFMPIYLTRVFGLTQQEQAGYQWIPYLGMDIGQVLGGFAILRLLGFGLPFRRARGTVLVAGMLGATLMLGMVATRSVVVAMLFFVVARFFFQFGYTALLTYGISVVPEKQTAQMNGLMNATFGVCNFIFNPVIGNMVKRIGFVPVLVMVSLTPLLGMVGWLVCSHQHERHAGAFEEAGAG